MWLHCIHLNFLYLSVLEHDCMYQTLCPRKSHCILNDKRKDNHMYNILIGVFTVTKLDQNYTSAKPLMLRRNGPSSRELRALEKQTFLRRLWRNRPSSGGSRETDLPPEPPEKQTFLWSLQRTFSKPCFPLWVLQGAPEESLLLQSLTWGQVYTFDSRSQSTSMEGLNQLQLRSQ